MRRPRADLCRDERTSYSTIADVRFPPLDGIADVGLRGERPLSGQMPRSQTDPLQPRGARSVFFFHEDLEPYRGVISQIEMRVLESEGMFLVGDVRGAVIIDDQHVVSSADVVSTRGVDDRPDAPLFPEVADEKWFVPSLDHSQP